MIEKTEDKSYGFDSLNDDLGSDKDFKSGIDEKDKGHFSNKDYSNDKGDDDKDTPDNSSGGGTNVTVDDVFSHDDHDGDYEASSNSTSTITTDTYGKQPEIEQNATSIQENKGQITTQDVFNIGGADFTKKNIETEEVLDASKKRTQAEQEDIADKKAGEIFHVGTEAGADYNKQIAESEKKVSEKQKTFEQKKAKHDKAVKQLEQVNNKVEKVGKQVTESIDRQEQQEKRINDIVDKAIKERIVKSDIKDTVPQGALHDKNGNLDEKYYRDYSNKFGKYSNEIYSALVEYGQETLSYEKLEKELRQAQKNEEYWSVESNKALNELTLAGEDLNKAKSEHSNLKKQQEAAFTSTVQNNPQPAVPETTAVTQPTTTTSPEPQQNQPNENGRIVYTKDGDQAAQKAENLAKSELTKVANDMEAAGVDPEQVQHMRGLAEAKENLAIANTNLDKNKPETVKAWVEAQKKYRDNLKQTNKDYKLLKSTDFNKPYNAAIANANNFEVQVTLPNGEKVTQSYEEFMSDQVTKSPELAAALYNQKAEEYRANGHPVRAKIEEMKAKLCTSWVGSKFVGMDNQIRNLYIQTADLDMAATYRAYNNVLNHPEKYMPEQIAEAKGAIAQAMSLKQGAAALKASTGFFSGIGDSLKDGVYGTTTASDLNAWQKTTTIIKNGTQAILGLGITPMANKAYQNAFYLNPDNKFFSKDFDKDGFAWTQEYGENPTARTIMGLTEMTAGVALCFNPSTMTTGIQMIGNSVYDLVNAVYSTRMKSNQVIGLIDQITEHVGQAKELKGLPPETKEQLDYIIEQIEDFKVKADQKDIDDWLEGAGSETNNMAKFNQKLSHDEWLALIRNDEVMKQLAKDKYAKKDNVD